MSQFRSSGFSLTPKKIVLGLIGIAVFITLIALATSFEKVPFGQEGYEYVSYGSNKGLDQDKPYTEGRSWIAPWNDLILISVQEQARDYHSEVLDKDGLDVTVDCIVNFRLTRGVGGKILSDVGKNWVEVIVDKATRGAIRDVAGKYTAEQLYSTKRDQMEVEIKDKIQTRLELYDIVLVEIEISDVDLPKIIQEAITAKMKQEQDNQKAQKKEKEAEYLANAKVQTARGDSLADVIRAAGQAEAFKIKRRELTKELLQEQWIERWDGKLSTVDGGGGGLILNMDNLKK